MKIKRIFDLILVILGLLVIWPVLALLALLILCIDGRPIVFVQKRIGKGGREFKMLKFRSMRVGIGPSLTVGVDARITPLGRLLRKSKLDELPQLLNVLSGEMSFVGPRPELEEFVNLYTPDQRAVLDLPPGITDPASIQYFAESEILAKAANPRQFYVETVMPDKIRINLEYARTRSLLTDLGFILKTLRRSVGLLRLG